MEFLAWMALLIVVAIFPAWAVPQMPWTTDRMRQSRRALIISLIFLFYMLAM
jgi:hypothetical protein